MELPSLVVDEFFWMHVLLPKDYLYEGLIYTYSLENTLAILKNACNVSQNSIVVSKERNSFYLTLEGYDKERIETLNKKALTCGWFVAYYTRGTERFKSINLNDALSSSNPRTLVAHYEVKYDMAVSKYPEYLYHATSKLHLPKILKTGLQPRSNSVISDHPDRIYFGITPEACKKVMEIFWKNKPQEEKDAFWENGEFVILKIHVSNEHKLRLFKDPTYLDKGFYTMNNIRDSSIKVDSEFKLDK